MIIVDSSVWVDYFNGQETPETNYLDSVLGAEPVAVGDLILTEVLQGFRSDDDFETARELMTGLTVYEMLGEERAIRAAECYRTLRRSGVTVRKTSDVIIGAFCIDAGIPLLFSDRDFRPMVRHLNLPSALSDA